MISFANFRKQFHMQMIEMVSDINPNARSNSRCYHIKELSSGSSFFSSKSWTACL